MWQGGTVASGGSWGFIELLGWSGSSVMAAPFSPGPVGVYLAQGVWGGLPLRHSAAKAGFARLLSWGFIGACAAWPARARRARVEGQDHWVWTAATTMRRSACGLEPGRFQHATSGAWGRRALRPRFGWRGER